MTAGIRGQFQLPLEEPPPPLVDGRACLAISSTQHHSTNGKMIKECDVDMSHMIHICHYVHLNCAESAKMKKKCKPVTFLSPLFLLSRFESMILENSVGGSSASRKRPSQGCGCSSTLPGKLKMR